MQNIGEFTPRPLAYCALLFLNLPLSVDNFNSPSSNPYFSVAPLIIFTKVLRGREAVGFVYNMYLESMHSTAKFRALIKSLLLMVAVSVEPFFRPPKVKGCCTCASTLASCDDKDLSASLLLSGMARKDHPSVEGRVSSEDEATPVALFVGRMGITPMRPMGGGDSIVLGDGALLCCRLGL
jgi:hypothetical protein